jgi:tRNA threonylcarbamoyladenosine biosynthesis protein TsaB
MLIVAFDTSAQELTVALGCLSRDANTPPELLAHASLSVPRQHATLLHPLIDDLFEHSGAEISAVAGVIVGLGPGSYTGARIGVAAAKAWAVAADVPLCGVSSLHALAAQYRAFAGIVAVARDARRDAAYVGAYSFFAQDGPQVVLPDRRSRYDQFAGDLMALSRSMSAAPIMLAGDGALRLQAELNARACPAQLAPASGGCGEALLWLGGPAIAVRLSGEVERSHAHAAHALVPAYLQPSEAEFRRFVRNRGSDSDEYE